MAVISSTWGLRPFWASASRCATPKRCCSSTTTSARSRKRTVSCSSAWVPTITRPADAGARARGAVSPAIWSSARSRSPAARDPVSSVTPWPSGSRNAASVSACCRASRSVGARSTAWRPASATKQSASAATAVFPEPTSPCRSRSMGRLDARSVRILSMAFCWSGVSGAGTASSVEPCSGGTALRCIRAPRISSTAAQAARNRASGTSIRSAVSGRRWRSREIIPTWSASSSSNASRRRAPSRRSKSSGKCTCSRASPRPGRARRSRIGAGR